MWRAAGVSSLEGKWVQAGGGWEMEYFLRKSGLSGAGRILTEEGVRRQSVSWVLER